MCQDRTPDAGEFCENRPPRPGGHHQRRLLLDWARIAPHELLGLAVYQKD